MKDSSWTARRLSAVTGRGFRRRVRRAGGQGCGGLRKGLQYENVKRWAIAWSCSSVDSMGCERMWTG